MTSCKVAHKVSESGIATDLVSVAAFERIVEDALLARCTEQLKPIRAVASQLRTTSRTGSSAYIASVFRPLRLLLDEFPNLSSAQLCRSVASEVFSQFGVMLASVRKTEDLLRRHRKSRKTGFSLFGTGDTSDGVSGEEERRFDEQMREDIETLGREAGHLGVPYEDMAEWQELRQVMGRPIEA
jgi:hypothetical protein